MHKIDRRKALGILGGTAGAAVAAARGHHLFAEALPAIQTWAMPAASCVLSPELTEGPYFVDERLNRSNLTTNTTNVNVTTGVPLTLAIGIVSASTCTPLPGLQVDIWHCDAGGKYSDEPSEGTSGQTFLRGYQVTDTSGLVTFTTIWPGWYTGRAVHIHVMVRQFNATGGQTFRWTTQFFFDPATTLAVFARSPYSAHGTAPDRANSADSIYLQSGGATLLTTSGNASTEFTSAITLAVALEGETSVGTPEPPTDLVASSIAGSVVTLRWNAPTTGAIPTNYVLEGGMNPGESLASVATGSTNPIYRFTAPTGAFYARMRTQSGSNQSAASNEVRLIVNTSAIPSAPVSLLATVNGSSLALAWRNTFGGGTPTSIVLDVTGSVTASIPLGALDTATFDDVPAGTYTLSLRATNASGTSDSSNAVTVTVPSACSGAPLTPANFLAYRSGTTLFVVWDPAASGPAPTGYIVNITGSFTGSIPTTGRALSGAVGAGTYNLSVVATNACGSSPATPAQVVTIT